eukprot:Gregarina_sp_Poly_1__3116@NODE_1879_length_3149_cov_7_537638_g1219_i0_p1_GENE_NODE_1879_length_3149_cov_7_537638_g1219_i0NODE_1879_length_3149_cov_7_537638_g1219_i0_p1_ORF_typecomplete_len393_score69_17IMCp/PF12314_8/1_1IMCp/PF12314_8/6_3e08IMCp/PF12314_8/3e03LPD29/PF18847_1/0_73_NODE_1879_length_3149_cov_7_537638_g1219_i01591337
MRDDGKQQRREQRDPPSITLGQAQRGTTSPGGGRRISLTDVPIVEGVELPPREETREVQEAEAEEDVKKIVIPHVHIKEEFEEVPMAVRKERYSKEPRIDVLHRKINIPKPVKTQKIVEMPQLHVIDRITEKYEDIYKEKIIEKPKYIIQERIIPVPKRQVEEITVKVPKEKFEEVVNAQMNEITFDAERDREEYAHMEDLSHQALSGPKYRHIPRPVEIPMIHYKPSPIERIVDRNVPIPIELHVIQEFQCPVLIPVWAEAAVPIHVTRVIEKPVPADALTNKVLLSMYMQQTQHIDRFAEQRQKKSAGFFGCCAKEYSFPVKSKMTDVEMRAAGLNHNLNTLKTMNSRAFDIARGFNQSVSGGFFTDQRTILKERDAEEILGGGPNRKSA